MRLGADCCAMDEAGHGKAGLFTEAAAKLAYRSRCLSVRGLAHCVIRPPWRGLPSFNPVTGFSPWPWEEMGKGQEVQETRSYVCVCVCFYMCVSECVCVCTGDHNGATNLSETVVK